MSLAPYGRVATPFHHNWSLAEGSHAQNFLTDPRTLGNDYSDTAAVTSCSRRSQYV